MEGGLWRGEPMGLVFNGYSILVLEKFWRWMVVMLQKQ
jgi:hypothetical protein